MPFIILKRNCRYGFCWFQYNFIFFPPCFWLGVYRWLSSSIFFCHMNYQLLLGKIPLAVVARLEVCSCSSSGAHVPGRWCSLARGNMTNYNNYILVHEVSALQGTGAGDTCLQLALWTAVIIHLENDSILLFLIVQRTDDYRQEVPCNGSELHLSVCCLILLNPVLLLLLFLSVYLGSIWGIV